MDIKAQDAKAAAITHKRDELLVKIAELTKLEQEDKQFSRSEAALYLGVSVRTLVRLAKAKEPPPMVAATTSGTSRRPVYYRLSTLMDYRNSEGYKADGGFIHRMTKAAVDEEKRRRAVKRPDLNTPSGRLSSVWHAAIGFLSDNAMEHRQAWVSTAQADSDAAEFAFFVDERGLILSHAWQSVEQTFEMLMSAKTDVVWQTWIAALAGVWADENERQRVLMECADIDASVPQKVQDLRSAKLAAI